MPADVIVHNAKIATNRVPSLIEAVAIEGSKIVAAGTSAQVLKERVPQTINRYGADAARHTPPFARMLRTGILVGAGTDATRVASYNPWVSLHWMVGGKTVGGTPLYPEDNRLDRTEALRRYTLGSAWFSIEEDKKGAIAPGQLADLAVLSADYFSVPEQDIKGIESMLTRVGGKIVYGSGAFVALAPPPLPIVPDWSPVKA
jgi:predicted amidohydrolase YtcJ